MADLEIVVRFVKFLIKVEFKTEAIIENLIKDYGVDTPKKTTIYEWETTFRDDGIESFINDDLSGKSTKSITKENVALPRNLGKGPTFHYT